MSVGQPPGHPPVHAFLGVPLRVGATLIGVLGVANKPGGYGSDDERLLSTFANQVATAIDNGRLYEVQREMIKGLVSVVDLATSGSRFGESPGGRGFVLFDPGREPPASGSGDSGSGAGVLTDGQREILALVSEGYSNREIASACSSQREHGEDASPGDFSEAWCAQSGRGCDASRSGWAPLGQSHSIGCRFHSFWSTRTTRFGDDSIGLSSTRCCPTAQDKHPQNRAIFGVVAEAAAGRSSC